jgi:hypothetical protein
MAKAPTRHDWAVRDVVTRLRKKKILPCQLASPRYGVDLIAGQGDARIRVKTTSGTKQRFAKHLVLQFNLVNHKGKGDLKTADFYILKVPPLRDFRAGIYLVVPASEIGRKWTVWMSLRSLVMKWGRWADRWDLIREFHR